MPRRTAVTWETVREIALKLPRVADGTSYGPALKVKKKLLARLRDDGQSVAFRISFDDREILMKAKPDTFYITDHYRAYPAVVVRLAHATRDDLANIIDIAWKFSSS